MNKVISAETMLSARVLPGAMLGVLGGGQLGRMFCVAARTMGYRVLVMDPDERSPAGKIADVHLQADFQDQAALSTMAAQCDVITTEFENIPADSLRFLAASTPVYPSADVLEIAQDRDAEKRFAKQAGLTPVPYFVIKDKADCLRVAGEKDGSVYFPAILKSTRLGYDGKGQVQVASPGDLEASFLSLGEVECVLEKQIDLSCEVSAIVARNRNGEMRCFPVSENQHRNGVLHAGIVPARVTPEMADRAEKMALKLADKLGYVGVLAVEFFADHAGELYFNEMAPRPHNSGHYTKDACVTSQFEQQVRMICGLSPGDTRLLTPVVMINLLGDLWHPDWMDIFEHDNIKLHLYGKHEARPGRKMGHFNVLAEEVGEALKTAESVFDSLESKV